MAQGTGPNGERGGSRFGLGIVLIIVGVLFLINQVLNIDLWATAWPLGIAATGVAFFVAMLLGGKSMSGLAIPGSVITTIGLILAYQNQFNRWDTWSYAWALIVVAVGVGNLIRGFWTDDAKAFQNGLRLAGMGATMFVIFGSFFELILGINGDASGMLARWFWPVALIALGTIVLLRSKSRRGPQ